MDERSGLKMQLVLYIMCNKHSQ